MNCMLSGSTCIVMWVVWVTYPETLTAEAINNRVVNLTDILCACVMFCILLLAVSYAVKLEDKEYVAALSSSLTLNLLVTTAISQ